MNIDLGATIIALLTFFGISALMALSLNLEYGIAGIPNFGQALFVSIGAYTAGWTYTRLLPWLAGKPVLAPCGSTLGQALQTRSVIMRDLPTIGLTNFVITLLLAALIARDQTEQRAFAAAIWTNQPNDLALRHSQRNAIYGA
jgi:branched-chain amino acid transport system permease protein